MKERNEEICQLYREGLTQEAIAQRYSITKMRIGQILHASGLNKRDRVRETKVSIGVLLPVEAKQIIIAEAVNEGKSISKWVSEILLQEIENRGIKAVPLVEEPRNEPRLPLEG